ncbi:MAG: DUF4097 family beta strand repeat-containing protein [Defluviitaleaceae bacterium]|nr:DUF4097 family beta strand repeat-containing protein [Defluviitaleaceae bacterium]
MNEKLRILKMIEDGKITASEAAQLLQAVDSAPQTSVPPAPPPLPPPPRSDSRYEGYESNTRSSSGLDDLGNKFESFAREVAPKVERFAEAVADKIAGAADYVSGAFTESGSQTAQQGHQGHHAAPPPKRASGSMMEKQIELLVDTGGYNELNLSCMNGDIRLKGYNGDKITAKLTYRASRANAYIELVKLGGKYFLKYEPDEFQIVSIDAYVPERAFGIIKIDGVNGMLDASSLSASEMHFSNSNGAATLTNLAATKITADSSNGRFAISSIAAETAEFENLNGPMDTDDLDISKLKLSNYNAPLSIIMSKFMRYSDYVWSVETGNAKLNINLPSMPDYGYHIKAHAAMSEIRIGLTGLQYLINEKSFVEARSITFDHAAKKIKLAVETSNAPLLIN